MSPGYLQNKNWQDNKYEDFISQNEVTTLKVVTNLIQ
jgi:hypothetical protein